jgi:hypothetical protein
MMTQIENVAKERVRVTDALLNKLCKLDDFVTDVCYVMNDYPKLLGRYKVVIRHSNIGVWPSLEILEDELESFGHKIPDSTKKLGQFFYIHGDFSAGCRWATREEIIQLAHDAEELLRTLYQYVADKHAEETQLLSRLEKVVQALQ